MGDCLVTGGAGFIGSHLAVTLLAEGRAVRVLDNFSTGRRENLSGLKGRFTLIAGDLNDPKALGRAMEGVELVFHQAALPSVPRSVADPVASNRANVGGTVALLQAAHRARVRRVIYASSSSAYGNSPCLPRVETQAPEPVSPYAVSKLAGELYCRAFWKCFGLETVSLRYFNVFGPRQDPNSQYAAVIPVFITAVLEGRPPTVFGDGEQSRDFTYVENAVRANLLAAAAPEAVGKVFNVGCGAPTTVNEVVAAVNRLLGTDVPSRFAPDRPGDVRHSSADITLARELLGYAPEVSFDEGLRRTIEHIREGSGAPAAQG